MKCAHEREKGYHGGDFMEDQKRGYMCNWGGQKRCGVRAEEGGQAAVEAAEAGISSSRRSRGVRFGSGEMTPWPDMKSMPGDYGIPVQWWSERSHNRSYQPVLLPRTVSCVDELARSMFFANGI